MIEQWRDVPGFEGQYQVSDQGRVRSLDHRVRLFTRWGAETTRLSPGRVLRPGRKGDGHLTVAIGKGNSRQVHQLVMEAFGGPCPDRHEVLHLNHTPTDNRFTNLRYGTRGENLKMDYVAGTRTQRRRA